MEITDHQVTKLLALLQSSLERTYTKDLCYTEEERIKLFNEIMAQQLEPEELDK